MSTIAPERPESENPTGRPEADGIVQQEHAPSAVTCPVCGSSSTYQTAEGRWGCVQCGSSWA
jgi:ribosomal protein L37AE/L43A